MQGWVFIALLAIIHFLCVAAVFASCFVLSYAKICSNITLPLNITARTAIFDVPELVSNSDATAFVQNLTRQGENFTEVALTGYQTIAKTYIIATKFCTPSEAAAKTSTVQILTHGLGFDRSYWDLPFNNFNYSYTAVATDEYKYCTLSYDRLGLGQSSHGDPINEIQASLEVAVLAELTVMLRQGKYPGAKQPFEKVVHVGHSFGSALTYALVSAMPTLSDGVVLTGLSLNSSFIPLFLVGSDFVQGNLNQPFRFGNITDPQIQAISAKLNEPISVINDKSLQASLAEYDLVDYVAGLDPRQHVEYAPGYLINSNANANQYNFFLPGHYDPEILTFAEENKQPVTLGELLTQGSAPRSSNFTGAVLVLRGSNDLPFCGGNCTSTGNASIPSIPATVKAAFPKVDKTDFAAYIQPETGHGINLHYNATGAYSVINHFLQAKGLQSQ